MKPDPYHDIWHCVMGKWILAEEKERNTEGRNFILKFKNGMRASITIGIWTVKETVTRLMIRLAWFYKYPHSLEAEIRRIEVLDDKVFYVSPYDVVRVLDYTVWKTLNRNEVNINNPDNVFKLIDNISRYFSDEARNDLDRLTKNLKLYESYVEY